MSEFGTIGTVDEVKRQLIEDNKTFQGLKYWEEIYGSVSLMGKQAESAVTYDYAKAMSEAYASSLQTDIDIISSNLGQGFKERELSENQLALEEAFASYQQNYLEGMQTVAKTTAEAEESVTSQLETEAKNVEGLNASVYNYLEYLFKKDPKLLETLGWQEYLNYTPKLDAEGKEITDDEGKVIYDKSLKSWDELTTARLDDNNEYISLVDKEGNLTIKGIDFYDKIMNQINTDQYGVSSWQNWLRETNPELYDWSQSYNPYDYSVYIDPNTGEIKNTHLGSFRTMVGLTSSDQTYAFIERFGGMTEKELNAKLDVFKTDISNIVTKMKKADSTDAASYLSDVKDLVGNLKETATELGIVNDIDFATVEKQIEEYIAQSEGRTNQYYKEGTDIYLGAALTGASIGAAAGAFGGPLTMGIGASVGLLIGVFAGTAGAVGEKDKHAKDQDAYMKQAEEVYMNLLTTMITHAQQKRRQTQIDAMK